MKVWQNAAHEAEIDSFCTPGYPVVDQLFFAYPDLRPHFWI